VITALFLSTALLSGATSQQGLADLTSRLQDYLDVRRAAAQTVPPLTVTNDRAATIAAADALAGAIVRARAHARAGDIFTPPIAAAVRAAIASGCDGRFGDLRRTTQEELDTPLPVLAVNDRWPIGVPLPTMPPDVLEALPPLPETLEYRFLGSALVLRDIDANVVVDLVRDAIPASTDVTAARLISGVVPPIPIAMLAGGQAFLELTIDYSGQVAGVKTLRTTGQLTGLVADAVRAWRFAPSTRLVAETSPELRFTYNMPRIGKVFVGALFRAPAIAGPTLGTVAVDADAPSLETPVPVRVETPAFPAAAFGAGVVLVELHVNADGSVSDACVIQSAPPFDEAAIDAARQFRFRPARVEGMAVASYAYVLFGFPLPITHDSAR
jgi:TonB family protein